MLHFMRSFGEAFVIADELFIQVVEIGSDSVRLFHCPVSAELPEQPFSEDLLESTSGVAVGGSWAVPGYPVTVHVTQVFDRVAFEVDLPEDMMLRRKEFYDALQGRTERANKVTFLRSVFQPS